MKQYSLEENIKALQICGFRIERFSDATITVSKWYDFEFRESFPEKDFNADEVICRFAELMRLDKLQQYKQELIDRINGN